MGKRVSLVVVTMNHKQRGLSLIEVLVSMTLISVTLLTLMKAHLYLHQHSQYARQAIAAQALAEKNCSSGVYGNYLK